MEKENTYVMIKPDGVEKHLLGEITNRIYKNGLEISHIKLMNLSSYLVKEHYAHLLDRDFYPTLEEYITSGPVVAMIVSGEDAVNKIRTLIGPTDSRKAEKGTIRGDFGEDSMRNIIHASDSVENAKLEIIRFYGEDFSKMLENATESENRLYKKYNK